LGVLKNNVSITIDEEKYVIIRQDEICAYAVAEVSTKELQAAGFVVPV
jgi:hypothetical protein